MAHFLFSAPVRGPQATTLGIDPQNIDVKVTMRGGTAAAGDVLVFDLDATDAAVTSGVPGTMASIWSNVRAAAAAEIAGQSSAFVCVALEAMADDAEGMVRIHGIVDAFVIGAAGSMAVGTQLVLAASNNADIVQATGERIIGIGLEAVASPTTRTLGSIYINGFISLGIAA